MENPDALPLSGIRVIDLTQILQGSYCALLMATDALQAEGVILRRKAAANGDYAP
jgi:crotonobetainyl-CoA:carnitine CoA-transferase CaiB-like acyl-CoA transferase